MKRIPCQVRRGHRCDPQQLQDGYIKTVRPAFSRLTRKEGSEKRNKGDLQSYISLEGVCVCVYTPLSLSAGGSCALTRPVLKQSNMLIYARFALNFFGFAHQRPNADQRYQRGVGLTSRDTK